VEAVVILAFAIIKHGYFKPGSKSRDKLFITDRKQKSPTKTSAAARGLVGEFITLQSWGCR
jgi:hypothetical protein